MSDMAQKIAAENSGGNGTGLLSREAAKVQFGKVAKGMGERAIYRKLFSGKYAELVGTRAEKREQSRVFAREAIKALKKDGLLK